jgi:hypothetical protein
MHGRDRRTQGYPNSRLIGRHSLEGTLLRRQIATILLLACSSAGAQQAQPMRGRPFAEATKPLPHRVFATSKMDIDRFLARPYNADVPFGSSGDRLWATSPQGWGFGEGVNYLYYTNSSAFDLKITAGGIDYAVARAFYTPSRVHMIGAPDSGDKLSAAASFTYSTDGVERPLAKPFRPDKRWTCWSSGRREDWYTVRFGKPRLVSDVDLYFYDDEPQGGCAPPESVRVEAFRDRGWSPVPILAFTPRPNRNGVHFQRPEQAEQIRFTFRNRGVDKYTGLFGVEPHVIIEPTVRDATRRLPGYRVPPGRGVRVEADKWIMQDDALMTRLTVMNPTTQPQPLFVRMNSPLRGTRLGFADETSVAGFPLYLRGGGAEGKARGRAFVTTVKPGETRQFTFALVAAVAPAQADAILERVLGDPDPRFSQTAEYQGWFDSNTAYFDCSDPTVAKMYYHRWYNVKKNSMNPRMGRLQHRAFSEGRWTADWYANVISYGAGHQIRESRWLRDPSYAWGHLQTWTENPRPDGIFPSHITPKGQQGGQYTEWIASTAWDTYLVHPDRSLLAAVADPVAHNAEGWRKTYGWNDSPLLVVDSHWWTGMEWQPSFFSFANYQTGGGAGTDPSKMTPLRRVDLTAYNFGNAQTAANIYRELGRAEDAERLQKLADDTRDAMLSQMWDPATHWFHSLRASDNAKSPEKEIVGLYPFYFDLPPKDKGYEAAWDRVFDPAQFWTPWPLASVARDSPAYSQNGWPVGPGGSGCMWNGPTWPHANSLVMSAMANVLRHYGPSAVTRRNLLDLFTSFTHAQYKNSDPKLPWTGEFYNGDTGEWKTPQRDYNHSTWIDPLIRDLIGLVPRNDNTLEIDSLLPDNSWTHYILDGQAYRGHDVTVAWDQKGRHFAPDFKGYAVYLDGKEIFHAPRPVHFLYDMAARKALTIR